MLEFLIDHREHGPIGVTGLSELSVRDRRATVGSWFGRDVLGDRRRTSSRRRWWRRSRFETLGMGRLTAWANTRNGRSQVALERVGFRREGVLRGWHRHGDAVHDVVVFGLMRAEWERSRAARRARRGGRNGTAAVHRGQPEKSLIGKAAPGGIRVLVRKETAATGVLRRSQQQALGPKGSPACLALGSGFSPRVLRRSSSRGSSSLLCPRPRRRTSFLLSRCPAYPWPVPARRRPPRSPPAAAAAPAPAAPRPPCMRRAMLCLVNHARASAGLSPFRAERHLARAAARHARDMGRRNYFAHVSPTGKSPLARARAAGWRGGVGEVIAWGCGTLASPRATLRAWLNSPPHRAIVLGGGRAAGVGVKRLARLRRPRLLGDGRRLAASGAGGLPCRRRPSPPHR